MLVQAKTILSMWYRIQTHPTAEVLKILYGSLLRYAALECAGKSSEARHHHREVFER